LAWILRRKVTAAILAVALLIVVVGVTLAVSAGAGTAGRPHWQVPSVWVNEILPMAQLGPDNIVKKHL
jgi:hypothetical protein